MQPGRMRRPGVVAEHVANNAVAILDGQSGIQHNVFRRVERVRVDEDGGVARGVEPVATPAFAVSGRGEQAVHHFLVSIGALVREERVHFRGRGRKPGEIQADIWFIEGAAYADLGAEPVPGKKLQHVVQKGKKQVPCPARRRGPHVRHEARSTCRCPRP